MSSARLCSLLLLMFVVDAASGAPGPDNRENRMHPQFQLLDAENRPVLKSNAPVSDVKTCGACHDTEFINGHSAHDSSKTKVSCTACHYQGGRIDWTAESFDTNGLLKRSWVRLAEPSSENCASCHGLAHLGPSPLRLPEDFSDRAARLASGEALDGQLYDFSGRTGAIFSPQNLSESYLNLSGKTALTYPWDVHARRLVECTHCHFSANNPERMRTKAGTPAFLKDDPRKPSLSEYLYRPDHRLAAVGCTDCHEAGKAHDFLPYKARHLQALSCQSCHIPRLMGPALESVDATVVNEEGEPRIEFRGAETPAEGNIAYRRGYSPFLLTVLKPDKTTRLETFNLVTRWQWVSGPGRESVPAAAVRAAYLTGHDYRPEIVGALDVNRDGRIGDAELILDSADKIQIVAANLAEAGIRAPEIVGQIDAYPINHGVVAGEFIKFDCSGCHQRESRLNVGIMLASRVAGGVLPDLPAQSPLRGAGTLTWNAEGGLSFLRPEGPSQFYVFGHSSDRWVDSAGLVFFALAVLLVAVHAGYRLYTRGRWAKSEVRRQRSYLFSAYERVWHWTMALTVVALLLTGFRIHYFDNGQWPGLAEAVLAHNFFAVVLTVNAFLALFYHVAGSAIRQFFPSRRNLEQEVRAHARYYLVDIFRGHPHPHAKTPERKLNPLQQITYLFLLNLLFPWQILTGALIWGSAWWPDVSARVGGLPSLAPLHQLGAWLFLSFFVLHVYLTTTGRTVLAGVKTMIDGYDEIEVPVGPSPGRLTPRAVGEES